MTEGGLNAVVIRFRDTLARVASEPDIRRPLLALAAPFPVAWCDRASKLLGRYLHEDLGLRKVVLLRGAWEDWHHAWLEVRLGNISYAVDVTATQFPDAPLVSSGAWHARFDVTSREPFPLAPMAAGNQLATDFKAALAEAYRRVVAEMHAAVASPTP